MTVFFDILILILLIFVNGFFSMSEFALVSSRKIKLKQMATENKPGSQAALTLTEDQTSFLSSIQIGITLVGICTGAFGGATFSHLLEPFISGIFIIGDYSSFISMIVVILVITYFSIVIGELVPKRIGLANPEKIACTVAPLFILITRFFSPVCFLTSGLTKIIVKILGLSHSTSSDLIEEEIYLLLEEGTESGVINEDEQDMVENVFDFGDSKITDLMIPRPDIVALDIEDPIQTNIEIMKKSNHSRYPIYNRTLDSIIGILSIRDLWIHSQTNQTADISEVMQDILVVPDNLTALDLLKRFREATSPLAVIIDEYGSVIGMITLHDLLEALVGDLSRVDNEESHERIVTRADGSWLVDGKTSLDDLEEFTGIVCVDELNKGAFRTLAGFILFEIGKIPKEGDIISWSGYDFEIIDMDGHRIDKVLVSRKNLD